jgi:hypothetical protein
MPVETSYIGKVIVNAVILRWHVPCTKAPLPWLGEIPRRSNKGRTLLINMPKGVKCAVAAAALLMTTTVGQTEAATELGILGTGDLTASRASAELNLSVQCDGPANEGETKQQH